VRTFTLTDPRGTRWRVEVATSRADRMRGLLGRDTLPEGAALLLPKARSVHSFGMRFPILAAFLRGDPEGNLRVVAVRDLPPGRLTLPRIRARHVLEAPAGSDLRPGDLLRR
jgi:uncharacterized protein